MADQAKKGARPRLACEVLPDRVIAARVAENRAFVEVYHTAALPAGTVAPGLIAANVVNPPALRAAIEESLGAVGGRGKDVIAVVPDAAVRLFLLDFDTLPDRARETESVVRFRLRKSVPFDVDRAAVSYDVRRQNGGGVKVVAAVMMASVIGEYETAFRDAGYSPGFVLPSMLASLGPVEGDHPTLVAKVDPTSITVAILDQHELRLLRTLENPRGAAIEENTLADDVYPSLVFYHDTYGVPVDRVLVAGIPSLDRFAAALNPHTSAKIEPLVTGRYLGASLGGDLRRDALAGVVGALIA